jgi:hypothetical protein
MKRAYLLSILGVMTATGAYALVGCGGDNASNPTNHTAASDAGGDSTASTTDGSTTGDDSATSTPSDTGVGLADGPPPPPTCMMTAKTGSIASLRTAATAPATGDVWSLTNVIATSNKFLVDSSKSGECLYGVYVADANTTFAPNSGVLVVSYGAVGTLSDAGKVKCADAETETASLVPATKVGDKLTVTGQIDLYSGTTCSPAVTNKSIQLKVCTATNGGAGTPVGPATVDQAQLLDSSPMFPQWIGGLVQVTTPTAMTATNTMKGYTFTIAPSGLLISENGSYDSGHGGISSSVMAGQTLPTLIGNPLLYGGCTWQLSLRDVCGEEPAIGYKCMGGSGDAGTSETGTSDASATDAAAGG